MSHFFKNRISKHFHKWNGLNDFLSAVVSIYVPFYLAIGDTRSRYKRSSIGPFWIVLSTLISVVGLGFVWSYVFNVSAQTIVPNLTVGLIIWQFCSISISESPNIFLKNASVIRNVKLNYTTFVLQSLLKNIIALSHNLIIIIMVMLLYPPRYNVFQFIFFPTIILLFIFILGVMLLFSALGAKYKDLDQIVSSLMPILFFLTPILFKIENSNIPYNIIYMNPLSIYIDILRAAIFGDKFNVTYFITAFILAFISLIVGIYSLGKSHRQIPLLVS